MSNRETVVQTVARVLGGAFQGAEIVDRDLSVGRERQVQLVAVDASGRLVLVVVLEAGADAALLLVLDAVAYARANASVLTTHLRETRLNLELEPVVAVVARDFDAEVLARLALLAPGSVRAFGLRRVVSQRGTNDYLVEIDLATQHTVRAPAEAEADFLETLPPEVRAAAELFAKRIARLDEELEPVRRGRSIAWRVRDEVVCRLDARDGTLEAHVPDKPGSTSLATTDDVEQVLESVVQRYLGLVHVQAAVGAHAGVAGVHEPLLSAEELAHFEGAR